ncbi:ATP-binding cassette domain-containing protein, partial [Vibrio parahaemolyticus]|nr:ATP-binding cassette domain-containing protein [Vibrio parahaemolyticus]
TGVYKRDGGTITIDGQERTFKNAKEAEEYGIAFIHQELNILPNLTVAENMFLGKELMYGKTGILRTRQMNAIAQQQLAELGLHVKGAMLAGELSVGQQQIIEIAKALMTNASVIIMDEPTSGLDPVFRRELLDVLQNIMQDGEKTIFFSSHITTDLDRIADYITFIQNGKHIFTKDIYAIAEDYVLVKGPLDLLKFDTEREFISVRKANT